MLYLVATERIPSRILLFCPGHLRPGLKVNGAFCSPPRSSPHLEQSFVELDDLLLKYLRSSLLSERRWLHTSWQQISLRNLNWDIRIVDRLSEIYSKLAVVSLSDARAFFF